jgi:hypothetical protein
MDSTTNGACGHPPTNGRASGFTHVYSVNTGQHSSLRSKERGGVPEKGQGIKGPAECVDAIGKARSAPDSTPAPRLGGLSGHEKTCVKGLEEVEIRAGELPGELHDYEWRKAVFRLAWALQALGYREPLAPDVRDLVRAWHARRVGCRGTLLDVQAGLADLWGRVKNPEALDLVAIYQRPDPRPLPAAVYFLAGEPAWEGLVRGCRSLSDFWRGGVFFLSYRTAADLIGGVCHVTAGNMLKELARKGVLRLVEKGSMRRLPGTDSMTASTWLWTAKEE